MKASIFAIAVSLLVAGTYGSAKANEPVSLFRTIQRVDGPPRPDSKQVFQSTLDVQGLATAPASVLVNIPRREGDLTVEIALKGMARRDGFAERDGWACLHGDPRSCEIIPIPGAPDTEFSYTWSGDNEGWYLRVTVHHGYAVGVLSGPVGRFALSWREVREVRRVYYVHDVPDRAPSSWTPPMVVAGRTTAFETVPVMSSSAVQNSVVARILPKTSQSDGSTSLTQIDMLVLFDEAARMQAQMIPTSTCTDVNDIIGLVIDNIEETDQVFKNSQMPVRVGVVTIAKLNGFSIIPNDPADPYRHTYPNLTSIRTSASVAALRNAVGADAVTFMTDTQAHLGVCGVAYIQRNVCDLGYADAVPPSPCIGAVFAPWMFNAVTVECTSGATDNFEHELGHLMGGDHDPPYAAIPSWQSYPFAFGLSLSGQFQTVMAQQFGPGGPDPQRILYFSNPNVYFGGIATGNASAANAIAMTYLAPGVEAFRARPEVVFANGFDAVSACPGITY